MLAFPPDAGHLAALRLHALIVNPALTGLDYIERVATALPGLALLVCSGPVTVSERVKGLRAGADDWVTKPRHPGGAARADPGRARAGAAPASCRSRRSRSRPANSRSAPTATTPTPASRRRRCRARSSSCCDSSRRPTAACSSARTSTSGFGATRRPVATHRSTCSCASCARSSSRSPRVAVRPHAFRRRLPVRGRADRRRGPGPSKPSGRRRPRARISPRYARAGE